MNELKQKLQKMRASTPDPYHDYYCCGYWDAVDEILEFTQSLMKGREE